MSIRTYFLRINPIPPMKTTAANKYARPTPTSGTRASVRKGPSILPASPKVA